jgi:hypothetical protein
LDQPEWNDGSDPESPFELDGDGVSAEPSALDVGADVCQHCGAPHPAGSAPACESCGLPARPPTGASEGLCPHCGASIPPGEGMFCPACGLSTRRYVRASETGRSAGRGRSRVGDENDEDKIRCPTCGVPTRPPVCVNCGHSIDSSDETS